MADTAGMDVSKLKVTDLKKELKSRGQPVVGNKMELIERLQACLQSGDATDDVDDKVLDEDSTPEDDTVVDTLTEVEDLKVLQSVSSTSSAANVKPEASKVVAKTDVTQLSDAERQELRASKFGVTSDEQKKMLRAKKFGLSNVSSKENDVTKKLERAKRFSIDNPEAKKKARAERFGIAHSGKADITTIAKTSPPLTDKMKRRMERFGVVTTTTPLNSASDKAQNRKQRFNVTTSSEVEAKKQKRAERFGLT